MNTFPARCIAAAEVESPVGKLVLLASEAGLCGLYFRHRIEGAARGAHPVLEAAERQLGEYFAGDRAAFDLPLDSGGTEFQRAVWAQLRAIPFGETRSYGGLATALGKPGAMRAVGLANGANPISIIVPCHRVVGADGSLTGFGGGLEIKRKLLEHEGALLPMERAGVAEAIGTRRAS